MNLFEKGVLKMKNKVILSLGVLLMWSGFMLLSCTAQSSNNTQAAAPPANAAEQFIGTWKQINSSENRQWVFDADGIGNSPRYSQDGINRDIVYAITASGNASGKIIIYTMPRPNINGSTSGYDYYFTDGGKTLILINTSGGGLILQKTVEGSAG
jgi:hypothetical protein